MSKHTFNCMYTKQKTKKRKAWSDGVIKVQLGQGFCNLYDDGSRGSSTLLESKILCSGEQKALMNATDEFEIDFENFTVTIDRTPLPASSETTEKKKEAIVKPFKIPKYKPPAPKPKEDFNGGTNGGNFAGTVQRKPSSRGVYDIDDDELDDLWGNNAKDSVQDIIMNSKPVERSQQAIDEMEARRSHTCTKWEDTEQYDDATYQMRSMRQRPLESMHARKEVVDAFHHEDHHGVDIHGRKRMNDELPHHERSCMHDDQSPASEADMWGMGIAHAPVSSHSNSMMPQDSQAHPTSSHTVSHMSSHELAGLAGKPEYTSRPQMSPQRPPSPTGSACIWGTEAHTVDTHISAYAYDRDRDREGALASWDCSEGRDVTSSKNTNLPTSNGTSNANGCGDSPSREDTPPTDEGASIWGFM